MNSERIKRRIDAQATVIWMLSDKFASVKKLEAVTRILILAVSFEKLYFIEQSWGVDSKMDFSSELCRISSEIFSPRDRCRARVCR